MELHLSGCGPTLLPRVVPAGHPQPHRTAEDICSSLETKRAGILAHCLFPFHTSLLEGINNKIKVLKRMAYGYRDDEYFFLKIMDAFPGFAG